MLARLMSLAPLLPLSAVLAAVFVPATARADHMYLQATGLTGEELTAPFTGATELQGFSLGTGGKNVQLSHMIDRATPGLLTAAATGKVLEVVTITVQTDARQTYLVMTLKNVGVSSVQLSTGALGTQVQTELRAERIDLEYSVVDARGGKTATERATIGGGK